MRPDSPHPQFNVFLSKITFFFCFFILVSSPVLVLADIADTDYTWTGAVNTDWNNAGNWTPSGFTGDINNDNVIIPLTANQPVVGPGASSCKQILTMAGVTISGAGTLTIAQLNAIASVSGTATITCNLSLPSRVTITNESDLTISGVISGPSIEFNKFGAGILTLTGTNTYTGATTIAAGILSVAIIGNGGVAGNLGQASGIASNLVLDGGTLQYTGVSASTNRAFTLAPASTSTIEITSSTLTISGGSAATNGALIKSGSGTLVFGGANLYTGATNISDGVLKLGAAERISNASALIVTIGANFDLAGFSETVGSIAGEGTISSTAAGNPILTAGGDNTSTTFGGLIQNGSATTVSFTKAGAGTLTFTTTNLYTGVTSINGGILSISVIGNGGVAGNIGQATNAASNLVLGGGTLQYTGATATTDRAITLTTATTSTIELSTNHLTIAGVITGGGSLTKSGIGTLTPTASNTYTGITRINAGILSIATIGDGGVASNLGQASNAPANLVLGGGTLQYTGVAVATDRGFTMAAASTTLLDITSTSLTISGIGTGPSTGNITKIGPGSLVLTGTNTFTGAVTINEGILSIGTFGNGGTPSNIGAASNAAANLVLAGGTLQYTGANTSTSRSFTLASGTTSIIEVTTSSLTIGGSAAASTGALIKTGNGKLVLTGSNLYDGTTLITAGVLNTQKAQGTGTNINGVTVSAGTALEIETTIAVLGESLSLSGSGVANGGAFRNISGNNSWSGPVTLSTPSRINADAGILTITGGVNGTGSGLTVGGAGATTITTAGINTGTSGTLSKDGNGVLTITAAGTYTGATTVTAGALNIQNANAAGTTDAGVSVSTGAALQLQAGINVGAEALILNGSGNNNDGALRNISGTNSWAGLITIGSSTTISSDAGLLTLDVGSGNSILGSFNLTMTGAGNTTVADPIATSAGALTKSGAGTLTLKGANTYTGGTFITAGILLLDAANVLADGGDLVLEGGTLKTGSTVGFNETVNTLDLNASSTLALGTNTHTLTFASSSSVIWANGATLTITGWTGGYDGTSSATAGRIYIGSNAGGLTAQQVSQVRFFDGINNLPAKMLTDGELVPAGKAYYAIASTNWNVSSTWSLTTGGAPASSIPTAGDIVYIGESVAGADVIIPAGYAATCSSLTIGDATNNTLMGNSLTLAGTTATLSVSGNCVLNRPAGNLTNAFHIGNGTVSINGSMTIDGTANNANRLARIDMSAGTLNIEGALIFNTNANAGALTNVIDMSGGAGTLNLGGPFTLTNNIGTLTSSATSTFNFKGTIPQTIPIGVSSVVYNHLMVNNTHASGATISAAISAARVTGNISIGSITSGSLLNTNNLTVSLAISRSLTIAENSTLNAGTTSISFGSSPPNPAAIINGTFKTTNITAFTGTAGGSINTINAPVTALGPNSLIEYAATAVQPVTQRTDYAHVTLSGGVKSIAAGTITISKTLTILAGATYNGTGNPDLNIAGDFVNNGTFTQGAGTVSLDGAGTQLIGGASSTAFNSLTINKSTGGVTLATSATINGLLTLTNGIIDAFTNNTTLTIGAAGTATSGSNTSYISGKLARIYNSTGSKNFPIGKGGNWREASINFTSLTGTSTVIIEQFESTIPGNIPITNAVQAGRYWNISQSGGSAYTYDITLDGSGFNPGAEDPVILKGDGISNTAYLATYVNPEFTATGLTSFSNFAVADGCIAASIVNEPTGTTTCEGGSYSMNVNAAGPGTLTYQWFKTGSGPISDDGIISGSATNTLTFNPVSAAHNGTYYVIVTRPCNSTVQSANAILQVNEVIGGTGSADQVICSGGDPGALSVTGSSASGTSAYQWISGTSGCNASMVNISGANAATYDPPSGLTQSTYFRCILTSTLGSAVCQDTSTCTTVAVNQSPTEAMIAVSPLSMCSSLNIGNLGGNAPLVGTGLWSVVSGGTGSFNNISSGSSGFTANAYGSYVLRWTISNSPCPSSSADITVNFYEAPTTATVGNNQSICGTLTSNGLGGNTPSSGTGLWSQVSGPGTTTFSNPSSGNTTASSTIYGMYTYRWTISNGSCPTSTADVSVIYYVQPVVIDAPNQSLCNTSSFLMTQGVPPVGAGAWSLLSGTATIETPGSPSTLITGVPAGTSAVLRWTVTNGTCIVFDDVTIQNDLLPDVSNEPDQVLCNSSSFTMTQTTPAIGTGIWSLVSGNATITDPGDPMTTITGVVTGTMATVKWTVTNGTCSSFDDVMVSNNQIIVSTVTDGVTGSLRDVISCAPPGSVITFSPALTGQTITLTGGEIEINKDLVINGPGMLNLDISGNNTSRIFHVLSGTTLYLDGMSLKDAAFVSNGGAILVEGHLILENILLQNNFENGINKAMTITSTAILDISGIVSIKN